jgi:hypothetical protein
MFNIGMPMKGLRRNDDAMKTEAGIQKTFFNSLVSQPTRTSTSLSTTVYAPSTPLRIIPEKPLS